MTRKRSYLRTAAALLAALLLSVLTAAAAETAVDPQPLQTVFFFDQGREMDLWQKNDTLRVFCIPVGAQDCYFITCEGHAMVLDCAGVGREPTPDLLFRLCDALGVTRLDIAFNTHPHRDHINGFAELLSEPDLTEEERQQYLRIIQDESARLAELTNRTLLLTKLQSQRFLPDQTTFSLDEQIRRCAILCANSWEEKRLTFSAELESVDCTSNEELLRQVWINLLNNAIRYTPPGGEIGVELRQAVGEAVVRVWDTGSGMTPEVQSHIFEKYYQGAAEDKKHGLGLGLSIVHRIIELTEGRIEVDSQPQQGSSFIVYLPLNQKGA